MSTRSGSALAPSLLHVIQLPQLVLRNLNCCDGQMPAVGDRATVSLTVGIPECGRQLNFLYL